MTTTRDTASIAAEISRHVAHAKLGRMQRLGDVRAVGEAVCLTIEGKNLLF